MSSVALLTFYVVEMSPIKFKMMCQVISRAKFAILFQRQVEGMELVVVADVFVMMSV